MTRVSMLAATLIVVACLQVPASAQTPPAGWPSDEIWYLPTTDGAARLFVLEHGSGPPVVVIHGGFGAEHSYLLSALKGLDQRHRFILYDQRGSLRSPAPLAGITLSTMVEDLETLRVALRLPRMTLLAHSMGTKIAMAYLRAHPDRVANVVLAGALPMQGGSAIDPAWGRVTKDMDKAGADMLDRPAVARILNEHPCPADGCSPQEQTRRWRIKFAGVNIYHVDRWRRMEGGRVFYNQALADQIITSVPTDYDYLPDFVRHPYPVTVVMGDHDFADKGNGFYRGVGARYPRIRVEVVANAGHNAWIDEPGRFREIVEAALDRPPVRDSGGRQGRRAKGLER